MNQNSKFLSLVIGFISIVIIVFVTYDFWMTLQTSLDKQTTLNDDLQTKLNQKKKFEDIKKEIESGKRPDIEKYVFDFKEDELIQYIYDFAQENNSYMTIKQISFEEGKLNEYGFKEGRVQIEARVWWEEMMLKFLDFLTSDQSKYRFFLDTFTYPNDGLAGSYNISIPLKIFYK